MDRIKIKDLEVFGRHGVYEEENRLGQKFLVSACLYLDTRRAGLRDSLEDSVNYGEVCHRIAAFFEARACKLIEAAAEALASELLRSFEALRGLTLEIKKPWAPIGLPLSWVSVEIERGWHTAYVALGSNMGDRQSYLGQAVSGLEDNPDIRVEQVSDWMETAPYGVTDQPEFLNGCARISTLLEPEELLAYLNQLEQQAGRERIRRWGPRTLDLDILLYEDRIMERPALTIPHRDMHNREFVLRPLCQIAPGVCHPVLHRTAEQLLQCLVERADSGAGCKEGRNPAGGASCKEDRNPAGGEGCKEDRNPAGGEGEREHG